MWPSHPAVCLLLSTRVVLTLSGLGPTFRPDLQRILRETAPPQPSDTRMRGPASLIYPGLQLLQAGLEQRLV